MIRLDRSALLVIVMAALGTAHLLVRTSTYGAAVDGVSVTYLSTAQSLVTGDGLRDFMGRGLLPTPPLYPLSMAAVALAGIEVPEAGRLVNVTSFALIILLSGFWLRRSRGSPLLAAGATLALTTSYFLTHFSSWITADSLFLLFTLLALMQMEAFSKRTVPWRSVVLAAAFTALAALTRYAGVAVIFTGVLLLLPHRGTPPAARASRAVVYGALSSLPVGFVFLRNHLLFGDFDKRVHRVGQSLPESLDQLIGVFSGKAMPADMPGWLGASVWWVCALAVLAGAALRIRAAIRRRARPSSSRAPSPPPLPARTFNFSTLEPALPFLAFSFVYLTFMLVIVTWTLGRYGFLGRYLLPPYVSLLLAGAWMFDRFLRIRTRGWASVAKRVSVALVLVACLGHFGPWAKKNLDLTVQALESGYMGNSYNTAHWERSETIGYLGANPVDTRVYCNLHGLLYALLALKTGAGIPGQYPLLPQKLHVLERRIEDGAYVVWLKPVEGHSLDDYEFDDTHLRALPGLETVAELSDGVIFRKTPGAVKSNGNVGNEG